MPVQNESFVQTLRAQWLGQQLRELRERRGFTLKRAAEFLERDFSSIARYERAEWPLRRGVLVSLLDLYGEHDARERARLIQLAENAWRTDRWADGHDAPDEAAGFIDFPWLQSRAQQICSYDAALVPGLLQTPDYAEAVIRNGEGTKSTSLSVAKQLRLRLDRQWVLDRTPPVKIVAIVDEAAVRRPVRSRSVMRAQLEHVDQLARRPNVEVRVLPSSAGLHAGLDGSFWLFKMPRPYPDVAHVEHLGGRLFIESPKADRYARAYDRLREAALDPHESAKLIATIAEEL